jgi:hypothetical protein
MLSWNRAQDQWETDQRPETLAEQICEQIAISTQEYDYRLLDEGRSRTDSRMLRLDAYLSGLEKLLDWSE